MAEHRSDATTSGDAALNLGAFGGDVLFSDPSSGSNHPVSPPDQSVKSAVTEPSVRMRPPADHGTNPYIPPRIAQSGPPPTIAPAPALDSRSPQRTRPPMTPPHGPHQDTSHHVTTPRAMKTPIAKKRARVRGILLLAVLIWLVILGATGVISFLTQFPRDVTPTPDVVDSLPLDTAPSAPVPSAPVPEATVPQVSEGPWPSDLFTDLPQGATGQSFDPSLLPPAPSGTVGAATGRDAAGRPQHRDMTYFPNALTGPARSVHIQVIVPAAPTRLETYFGTQLIDSKDYPALTQSDWESSSDLPAVVTLRLRTAAPADVAACTISVNQTVVAVGHSLNGVLDCVYDPASLRK